VTASLAAYFFWLSGTTNGADRTFDNFNCAANDALATGFRWLMLWALCSWLSRVPRSSGSVENASKHPSRNDGRSGARPNLDVPMQRLGSQGGGR
jgi:hypothetical protein